MVSSRESQASYLQHSVISDSEVQSSDKTSDDESIVSKKVSEKSFRNNPFLSRESSKTKSMQLEDIIKNTRPVKRNKTRR